MDSITNPTEGGLREQMAAYFLSLPPYAEQTPAQRREYRRRLQELGRLERRELLDACGSQRTKAGCRTSEQQVPPVQAWAGGAPGLSGSVLMILFGAPCAVSSYPMAVAMGGDQDLAAGILVLSTVCSMGTLFLLIYIGKLLAVI